MQRDQRDRQRRRLFEAHAVRHRVDASPVADGVFGIAAGAGAHDAVARRVSLDLGAGLGHLASPFEADRGADPAMAAVGNAARDGKVGAVERGGAHSHQHFVGLRLRLCNLAQRQSLLRRNGGFHALSMDRFVPLICTPCIAARLGV